MSKEKNQAFGGKNLIVSSLLAFVFGTGMVVTEESVDAAKVKKSKNRRDRRQRPRLRAGAGKGKRPAKGGGSKGVSKLKIQVKRPGKGKTVSTGGSSGGASTPAGGSSANDSRFKALENEKQELLKKQQKAAENEAALKVQVEQLKKDVVEAKKTGGNDADQIKELKAATSKLEAATQENNNLKAQLDEVKLELQHKEEQNEQAKGDVEKYKEELNEKTKQLTIATSAKDKAAQELQEATNKNKVLSSSLQDQKNLVATKTAELNKVNGKLTKIQTELNTKEQAVNELNNKINKLGNEKLAKEKALQDDLDQLKKAHKAATLADQAAILIKIAEKQQDLDKYKSTAQAQIDSLTSDANKAKNEYEQLKNQKQAADQEVTKITKEKDDADAEVTKLQKAKEELDTKMATLKNEKDEAAQKFQQAQTDLKKAGEDYQQQLANALEAHQQTVKTLTNKITGLEQAKATLEKDKERLNNEKTALETKLHDEKNKDGKDTIAYKLMQKQLTTAQKELALKETEIVKINENLDQATNDLQNNNEVHEELHSDFARIQSDIGPAENNNGEVDRSSVFTLEDESETNHISDEVDLAKLPSYADEIITRTQGNYYGDTKFINQARVEQLKNEAESLSEQIQFANNEQVTEAILMIALINNIPEQNKKAVTIELLKSKLEDHMFAKVAIISELMKQIMARDEMQKTTATETLIQLLMNNEKATAADFYGFAAVLCDNIYNDDSVLRNLADTCIKHEIAVQRQAKGNVIIPDLEEVKRRFIDNCMYSIGSITIHNRNKIGEEKWVNRIMQIVNEQITIATTPLIDNLEIQTLPASNENQEQQRSVTSTDDNRAMTETTDIIGENEPGIKITNEAALNAETPEESDDDSNQPSTPLGTIIKEWSQVEGGHEQAKQKNRNKNLQEEQTAKITDIESNHGEDVPVVEPNGTTDGKKLRYDNGKIIKPDGHALEELASNIKQEFELVDLKIGQVYFNELRAETAPTRIAEFNKLIEQLVNQTSPRSTNKHQEAQFMKVLIANILLTEALASKLNDLSKEQCTTIMTSYRELIERLDTHKNGSIHDSATVAQMKRAILGKLLLGTHYNLSDTIGRLSYIEYKSELNETSGKYKQEIKEIIKQLYVIGQRHYGQQYGQEDKTYENELKLLSQRIKNERSNTKNEAAFLQTAIQYLCEIGNQLAETSKELAEHQVLKTVDYERINASIITPLLKELDDLNTRKSS